MQTVKWRILRRSRELVATDGGADVILLNFSYTYGGKLKQITLIL
jgi:hypothetical protein